MSDERPIGVFDSGVGGLSVLREIHRQLPGESTVYLADQAQIPYGPKPAATVRDLAESATRFLLEHDCKAIVLACNTASAAALHALRAKHPEIPFVGMEPAVKPAAERSRSRVVGVMATPGTLQGQMFSDAVARFASGVEVINQPCTGLVEHIEGKGPNHPETRALLGKLVEPFREAGADTVVLACTHFAFVANAIRDVLGPGVDIIDPAPAVARQLGRVIAKRGIAAQGPGRHRYCTTGAPETFRDALRELANLEAAVEQASL